MICTFFGHSNTPQDVKPLIENKLRELLEQDGSITFYVGDKGNFDRMALSVLNRLSLEYPELSYAVVLAYLPTAENALKDTPTIYPEGIEYKPPKFAISYRNKWMVSQADTVICYISKSYGGAAQFVDYAGKHDKKVINLYAPDSNLQQIS